MHLRLTRRGDKPVDLLRQREYRRVLGVIDALAEGVYA